MASETFSLSWDNFHNNMSNGLSSLLKSENLVDVTLAAEGRYLKAHKMVLSVCSPYFQELFHVNPCKHPIVFLKDVSYSVLNNLLEFMYHGEVKVSHDDLGTFIKTAEQLQIKGLTGDTTNPVDTDAETSLTPAPVNNIKSVESSFATTLTRKTVREKSPPARKKMLGPASKRFKSDSEFTLSQKPEPQPVAESQLIEPQATLANDLEIHHPPPLAPLTTFKLEPEETAVSLANEEDITYDDSAMDELGMDNTADYMMDSTDEVKAGTSTEVANAEVPGENQGAGSLMYMVNRRGQMAMIFENNIFHVNRRYEGTTFWKCMEYKKLQCKCRCTTVNGTIKKSKTDHNHPPNIQKIQNKFLEMKSLSSEDPSSYIF